MHGTPSVSCSLSLPFNVESDHLAAYQFSLTAVSSLFCFARVSGGLACAIYNTYLLLLAEEHGGWATVEMMAVVHDFCLFVWVWWVFGLGT